MVVYYHQKTVMVMPDKDTVEKLGMK
jgi:hypothetical protein